MLLAYLTDSIASQRYSLYLPLRNQSSAPATPQPPTRDRASRRTKDTKTRPSAEVLSQKRRSTLNSREYYDEDEQLRRAIEESKKDGTIGGSELLRQNKRSRSDSDEYVTLTPTKPSHAGFSFAMDMQS